MNEKDNDCRRPGEGCASPEVAGRPPRPARASLAGVRHYGRVRRGDRAPQPMRPAVSIFGSARVRPIHPTTSRPSASPACCRMPASRWSPAAAPASWKPPTRAPSARACRSGSTSSCRTSSRPTLPGHLAELPPFLRAQVHVRQGRRRLRGDARRLRHPGRTAGGLTLIQTGKTPRIPLILVGSEVLGRLLDWFRDRLVAEGMINPEDMSTCCR
jgi:hypothetical protein